MINRSLRTTLVVAGLGLALAPAASARTETLRVYSKVEKLTLTKADGTVVEQPGEGVVPAAGDRLEVFASDYAGTHRKHSKRRVGSEHVVCTFTEAPAPDCLAHVALGSSMLIFRGFPGTIIGGTGKYLGATGRVLSVKEISGSADSDVVVRIKRR